MSTWTRLSRARAFGSADGATGTGPPPVGVSFFTFQAISYTVDVYRGLCQRASTVRPRPERDRSQINPFCKA